MIKINYKGVSVEVDTPKEALSMIKVFEKQPATRVYRNRKNKVMWTDNEIKFLLANLKKNISFFSNSILSVRHTMQAIATMKWKIINKRYDTMGKKLARLVRAQ
jgi:hypothetical protein